jgi:hypothetical protein
MAPALIVAADRGARTLNCQTDASGALFATGINLNAYHPAANCRRRSASASSRLRTVVVAIPDPGTTPDGASRMVCRHLPSPLR